MKYALLLRLLHQRSESAEILAPHVDLLRVKAKVLHSAVENGIFISSPRFVKYRTETNLTFRIITLHKLIEPICMHLPSYKSQVRGSELET
mgnify:CR=1 FL=1